MKNSQQFLILGGESRLAKIFKILFPKEVAALSRSDCDITSISDLKKSIKKFQGKYVINCAAVTDINECENKPFHAFLINSLAVANIAQECIKNNKKLIHISSDYAVTSKTIYGLSKLLSEKLAGNSALIIRTNFYDNKTYILNNLLAKDKTLAYTNRYINPISIVKLIEIIVNAKDETGIINAFSSKKISWYEFAKLICSTFIIDQSLIKKSQYDPKKDIIDHPLKSIVASDIHINIKEDLKQYKEFLSKI